MATDTIPFLHYERQLPTKRNIEERLKDYKEVDGALDLKMVETQAKRCMNCGIPFCNQGCPLGNIIPEFNQAIQENNWHEAYRILSITNNFPEFTGRICPAPCEAACVLGVVAKPVTIEYIEKFIIEKAFENGWVVPYQQQIKTGKKIAVIGSGPSGLATAAQLNKAGHEISVFEKNNKVGGLLRYGIPDFKLDKNTIDRRVKVMEAEGIIFVTDAHVGVDVKYATERILQDYDAVVLCGGSTIPRNLPIQGRDLAGIHFAMNFLPQQNKRLNKTPIVETEILATGKNVIVIGGGDTGADCVGTSNRQGAKSVVQLEVMPMPPKDSNPNTPWPNWPLILRTSTSHEEGCERIFSVQSKEFLSDEKGHVKGLKLVELVATKDEKGNATMTEKANSEMILPCELVLLAMGFLHPDPTGFIQDLNLQLDARNNVATTNYQTSHAKVFAAGDLRRGQSLVVWAISEGREAAIAVDKFLMGESLLPSKKTSYLSV